MGRKEGSDLRRLMQQSKRESSSACRAEGDDGGGGGGKSTAEFVAEELIGRVGRDTDAGKRLDCKYLEDSLSRRNTTGKSEKKSGGERLCATGSRAQWTALQTLSTPWRARREWGRRARAISGSRAVRADGGTEIFLPAETRVEMPLLVLEKKLG